MEIPSDAQDRAKYYSALKALEFVEPGMKLGLGTGSTAAYFVELIGEKVAQGMEILCVPTSTRTKEQAEGLNIPVTTLDEAGWLDLVVDGADEFDSKMNLIKGGGGALLQEKLVATASDKMIVISDDTKQVKNLGAFPLPIEVVIFGWQSTKRKVAKVVATSFVDGDEIVLRMEGDKPYVTDEGNYILDLHLKKIDHPETIASRLKEIVGVVESGFFIGIAKAVIIGFEDGTTTVFDGTRKSRKKRK